MQLSSEELRQFHHDGFIVLRGFLDVAQCDGLLKVAKEHLEQRIEPIETECGYQGRSKAYRRDVLEYKSLELEQNVVRRLRQVYERHPLFKRWMENLKIRPILKQILQDEVVITTAHHNSIMTKMPEMSQATNWHQDRRYWSYSDDNLLSIWLALGQENSENGALEFIPQSHHMNFSSEQFDEKEYFCEKSSLNKPLIDSKISLCLEKGDVILFHALLLHRANKNSTTTAKISFVYTVKGAKTKAILGTRSSVFTEIKL